MIAGIFIGFNLWLVLVIGELLFSVRYRRYQNMELFIAFLVLTTVFGTLGYFNNWE